jgi:DNA repair protein RadA/Sms
MKQDQEAVKVYERSSTGLSAVDHVLGGGLVEGAAILFAGRPGVGKTSLVLQVLSGLGLSCLYATGEETLEQVEATRRRVKTPRARIHMMAARELDLDKILARAQKIAARAIAIDTIYQLVSGDLNSRPGTPSQLRKCVEGLNQHAKQTGTSIWLVGRVTGDGSIAGPIALQHVVDVVLELEQGPGGATERLLRCPNKNRFGAAGVVGRLVVSDQGLVSINDSAAQHPGACA